ncbi:uncharacterized protein LOC117171744 [Belonocnema kinseyi]|uniref:uncharacterized protein LOC117171744 n=1 Tax=Belonocnema kinseyi TaxID=2817044 RepID=UPI00143DB82C|nr:uncharacterized protein LOC117171744 [Belonocnema kinseyi]
MNIFTLFFVCVALHNFAKVGAMQNSSEGFRGKAAIFERRQPRKRGIRSSDFPHIHPDLSAWINHGHTHPTEIHKSLLDASGTQNLILLSSFVENGDTTNWLFLKADLIPNSDIVSCNGPHGYAIVDLSDSERLYGCFRPDFYHKESLSSRHTGVVPVFLATVVRAGRYRLEAQLTSSDARSTLHSHGLICRDGDGIRIPGVQPAGHVRYLKSGSINPIDVEGDLYQSIG